MKVVLDSSIFVAAFREEEEYSREAFRIVGQLIEGMVDVIIPATVIVEVVAAIRRRTQDTRLAHEVGQTILESSTLSIIEISSFRMANMLDLAGESGLRGMDAIVVGVAREFDIPLVTLDQEMTQLAKRYVKVLEIDKV